MQTWPRVVRTTRVKFLEIDMVVQRVLELSNWQMALKGTILLARYPADKSTWWQMPQALVEAEALDALMPRLTVWRLLAIINLGRRSRCKLILWHLRVGIKTNNIALRMSKVFHSTRNSIMLGPILCRPQISWSKSLLLDRWAILITMKFPLTRDLSIKRSSGKW